MKSRLKMPRPSRIEYPNAFYHVMNRGRGRQNIFHNDKYFLSFLDTLLEVHQRFSAIIHAYCLMNNHYHIILETPEANLSRIMRHINGIYTQRYNRLKKTDGPLFRGRFKAIVIEEDQYLLNLNKYIHRNPIKLVKKLEDYKWSSYQSYLNLSQTPEWLNKSKTLEQVAIGNNIKSYKSYIEVGDSEKFIEDFYSKKITPAIMGGKDFKRKICDKILSTNSQKQDQIRSNFHEHIAESLILKEVAMAFEIEKEFLINRQKGRNKNNFPRKLAMYLCQIYAKNTLSKIKNDFGLKSVGSVSNALFYVKKELKSGKYKKELNEIKNSLYVIQ
jgi:putative transposase